MKLYVFNPDSDMALGNNDENYMPPASARWMAQDLAILPVWYAQPGSVVLAPSAHNADYLKEMQRIFPLSVQLVTEPELPDYAEAQIMPWGWNPSLRKYLLKRGIAEHKLPYPERLKELRFLSSRELAVVLLKLFEKDEDCCGRSFLLTDLESCQKFVNRYNPGVLKAPWSGSGKGLNWCKGEFTKSISGWCKHVLEEQQCVVGEPVYNRIEDFALEFYSDGKGKVLFVGYSLFNTTHNGTYHGNLLTSTEMVEKWISEYIPFLTIVRIREKLQGYLTDVFAFTYTGYLGVDMMICCDEPKRKNFVHPCVEINMRMTMGIVAHLFQEKFFAEDKVGNFAIAYHTSNEELLAAHYQGMEEFPLVVEHGRLVSGYLPLVPVTSKSHYRAYVIV